MYVFDANALPVSFQNLLLSSRCVSPSTTYSGKLKSSYPDQMMCCGFSGWPLHRSLL